jgi:hypothetical protein
MAVYKYNKSRQLQSVDFYDEFQKEISGLTLQFENVITDAFEGEFVITVDKWQPNVRYLHHPDEIPNSALLLVYINFLSAKMRETAEKISRLHSQWF